MKYIILVVTATWSGVLTYSKKYNPPIDYAILTDDVFEASVYTDEEIKNSASFQQKERFQFIPVTEDALEIFLGKTIDTVKLFNHLNSK